MLSLAKLNSLVLANMCRIDDCALKHWVHRREGSLLWRWPGVDASERTVHAVWLGESTVAALTTAGKIYTLPKQTGAPVADYMKRLTVRCFTHPCNCLGSSPYPPYPPGVFLVHALACMYPYISVHPQQLAHHLVQNEQQNSLSSSPALVTLTRFGQGRCWAVHLLHIAPIRQSSSQSIASLHHTHGDSSISPNSLYFF